MIQELLIAFALRSVLLCSSLLFRVILIKQNFALSLSLFYIISGKVKRSDTIFKSMADVVDILDLSHVVGTDRQRELY
jgi:hypothetical protein